MLRVLVADGNDAKGRREREKAAGMTSAEAYARVVGEIDASVRCALATPADADGRLPPGLGLSDIDAVIFTGSSLKVGEATPVVTRQVDLMRSALEGGLPVFGSCWGLHVATVACGGEVGPSDAAAEYAFARAIRRTVAGLRHPMLEGRESSWDAPAIHADVVRRPPPGSTVLAENSLVAIQAIEIAAGPGTFWGTQYHPELDLDDLASMLASSADEMVSDNQAPSVEWVASYARDIATLGNDPEDEALARTRSLGRDVTMSGRRRTEVSNFLAFALGRARPTSDHGS